ncbi:MAG: carboxypeptidase regulatory-like domain-containing protein [Planctomycetes bacterium]|nr:carboxypeptidase regulatory-like domain-containing protein [Planctomycetota bacterium]
MGATDGEGRLGPLSALVGVWSVSASDPKALWSGVSATPVFVESGRESRVRVDFVLARGALTCVDANGSALAGLTIAVLPASGGWMNDCVTDANGRIELELVPGEYAVQRGEFEPRSPAQQTVPLTWTATGPLSARVQL